MVCLRVKAPYSKTREHPYNVCPVHFCRLVFTYPIERTFPYVLQQFELFIKNQVTLYKGTSEKSKVSTNDNAFLPLLLLRADILRLHAPGSLWFVLIASSVKRASSVFPWSFAFLNKTNRHLNDCHAHC